MRGGWYGWLILTNCNGIRPICRWFAHQTYPKMIVFEFLIAMLVYQRVNLDVQTQTLQPLRNYLPARGFGRVGLSWRRPCRRHRSGWQGWVGNIVFGPSLWLHSKDGLCCLWIDWVLLKMRCFMRCHRGWNAPMPPLVLHLHVGNLSGSVLSISTMSSCVWSNVLAGSYHSRIILGLDSCGCEMVWVNIVYLNNCSLYFRYHIGWY